MVKDSPLYDAEAPLLGRKIRAQISANSHGTRRREDYAPVEPDTSWNGGNSRTGRQSTCLPARLPRFFPPATNQIFDFYNYPITKILYL